jgi:hypothetical protein
VRQGADLLLNLKKFVLPNLNRTLIHILFCSHYLEGGYLMGADCGYGGNVGGANVGPVGPWTSTGAILVLYILLVIILSACFI